LALGLERSTSEAADTELEAAAGAHRLPPGTDPFSFSGSAIQGCMAGNRIIHRSKRLLSSLRNSLNCRENVL
jgi:hypothetical protein